MFSYREFLFLTKNFENLLRNWMKMLSCVYALFHILCSLVLLVSTSALCLIHMHMYSILCIIMVTNLAFNVLIDRSIDCC